MPIGNCVPPTSGSSAAARGCTPVVTAARSCATAAVGAAAARAAVGSTLAAAPSPAIRNTSRRLTRLAIADSAGSSVIRVLPGKRCGH
ncbi:hypothetical protein [Fodinicola feengrottensis]|uniref:hypothetical protein n=1 Tax=Fodinicola feengrottensis TaxID=435914 RepID=UPI0013D1DB59|nr:hypothetical protein [Fodinicola feengrottensis]